MIKIEEACFESLVHLLRDDKSFVKLAQDLEKDNPNVPKAIEVISRILSEREEPKKVLIALGAFIMYNLIRIQIESNDLE